MQESTADLDLALCVTAKGHEVTPRQVRRWRDAGVLPATNTRSLGRGRGVEASYPEGALDVAVGFAQALSDARANGGRWALLHRAVLVAFVRRVEVGDAAIERAYRQMQATMAEALRSALSEGKVPQISFGQMKRPKGRSRKGGTRNEAGSLRYDKMVEGVAAVMLGREPDTSHLRTFLDGAGCPTAGLTDNDLATIAENVSLVAVLGHAVNTIKNGQRVRLEQARDLLIAMRSSPVADLFPAFTQELADDLNLAVAIPGMLVPMPTTDATT